MKNRFVILWIIWTFVGTALIYGISASDTKSSIMSIIANILSLAPLMGIMLALGSVKAFQRFNDWVHGDQNSHYYIAGGISILFMLPGILMFKFDPYFSVIFASIVFTVLGVLKQSKEQVFTLTLTDLLLWIVLWIPFDLRWYMGMLPAGSDSYAWFSVALSVIAIIGWNGYRGAGIGYNLVPNLKDLRVIGLSMLIIMAFVVPPGLLTGFLTFSIPESYNIPKLVFQFIGLFLTVALPEELFFRGICHGPPFPKQDAKFEAWCESFKNNDKHVDRGFVIYMHQFEHKNSDIEVIDKSYNIIPCSIIIKFKKMYSWLFISSSTSE